MITSTICQYDSSTLTSAAYNFKHKTLTVHFNHASYVYHDVDVQDWHSFNNAESQGKALNEFIKGKYEYHKVNETINHPTGYD
jgi:hypothetical protein|tara:strand:+ start:20927 stop:21175 length:249 start_codon:yes stop_codon:yes gene_type:complete